MIPDVENAECVFTDGKYHKYTQIILQSLTGCGKISIDLAKSIWKSVQNKQSRDRDLPSAFQFRLGGLKGMVTVDSNLHGSVLCYRPSMEKFSSPVCSSWHFINSLFFC